MYLFLVFSACEILSSSDLLQSRVLPFDTDEVRVLPVSIEVKVGSTLWSEPGTPGVINFEVTNNMLVPVQFYFNVNDNANFIQRWEPQLAFVSTGNTVLVRVEMESRSRGSSPDIVSLKASWRTLNGESEFVTKKVYFYTGSQIYDSSRPDIWYSFGSADCSGASTPQNCNAKTWRADISIQDSQSGVLKIHSEPVGITLKKEFVSGTREIIEGFYVASCCNTKVDVTATDVLGNVRTRTIDIERKWLTIGEISAIVLGSILLLAIIILIIYALVKCYRKKQRSLNIYTSHRVRSTE